MVTLLNIIIVFLLITTFLILIVGLLHGAKSEQEENNKINFFMKYRVIAQFVSILFLCIAIYLKSQL